MIVTIVASLAVLSAQRAINSSRPRALKNKLKNIFDKREHSKPSASVEELFGAGVSDNQNMVPFLVNDVRVERQTSLSDDVNHVSLSKSVCAFSKTLDPIDLEFFYTEVIRLIKIHQPLTIYTSKYIVATKEDLSHFSSDVFFTTSFNGKKLFVVAVTELEEQKYLTSMDRIEKAGKNQAYGNGRKLLQKYSRYPSSLPDCFYKNSYPSVTAL